MKRPKKITNYTVIDKDTGEILSKHKRMDGSNGARNWLKSWKESFNAVIVN